MQALQQNPKLHGTLMGHDNVLKWFSNGQHIGSAVQSYTTIQSTPWSPSVKPHI